MSHPPGCQVPPSLCEHLSCLSQRTALPSPGDRVFISMSVCLPWWGFRSHVTSILIIAWPCTMSEMLQFLKNYKENRETIEWRCQRSPLLFTFRIDAGPFSHAQGYTLPSNQHSVSDFHTILGFMVGSKKETVSFFPLGFL